jgi:sortase (surface protein transpeptidase)
VWVRGGRTAALFAAVVVASGLAACANPTIHSTRMSQGLRASPGASSSARSASDPAAGFRSPRTYPRVALPARLRIPAIGVDTSLERLGVDKHGEVEAPKAWRQAGWYTGSARPGQAGPAVILGHIDSTSGPAVFYRLASLRAGDAVEVTRVDGSRIVFHVSGRQQVAKSQFPSDLVYGPTLEPSLRLVTCAGSFDARSRHYRDNIIVFAVLS